MNQQLYSDTSIPALVDVVLFAGQSNMAGRGDAAASVVCPPDAGFEFHAVAALARERGAAFPAPVSTGATGIAASAWPADNVSRMPAADAFGQNEMLVTPLTEPFGKRENNDILNDYNSAGVERRRGSLVSAFAVSYAQHSHVPVVGVSACRGGAPVSFFAAEPVLSELQARFSVAVRTLSASGTTVRRRLCLWCQGETDGDRATSEEAFQTNMETLWAALKKAGITDLFIIKTGHFNYALEKGADGMPAKEALERDARYKAVNRWQEAFAAAHADVHIVGDLYTDHFFSLMRDHFHYTQAAYNEIGAAAGLAVSRIAAQEVQ